MNMFKHPEQGAYIVGMKSYGRAPTFLMITGYEQVRSVVAALAGDWAAARNTRLVLPETGVCHGPGIADANAAENQAGCCGPKPKSPEVAVIAKEPVTAACCGS